MGKIDKHIEFVKEQIDFHTNRAEYFSDNPHRKNKHLETANKFKALLHDINALLNSSQFKESTKRAKQLKLSLTPEDIEGLPDELMKELSVRNDKVEFAILNLLEEAGGVMSLDQIIVGLYRITNKIYKRTRTTNKLYRMAQNGLISSVPAKKGVYSLSSLSKSEVDNLPNENSEKDAST